MVDTITANLRVSGPVGITRSLMIIWLTVPFLSRTWLSYASYDIVIEAFFKPWHFVSTIDGTEKNIICLAWGTCIQRKSFEVLLNKPSNQTSQPNKPSDQTSKPNKPSKWFVVYVAPCKVSNIDIFTLLWLANKSLSAQTVLGKIQWRATNTHPKQFEQLIIIIYGADLPTAGMLLIGNSEVNGN